MTIEPHDLGAGRRSDPQTSSASSEGANNPSAVVDRSKILMFELERDEKALEKALSDDDHSIRALALGAMHRVAGISGDALRTALADEHRDVRVRAIEVSVLNDQIDLEALLDDDDDLVVETAAWALGEREVASVEIISALTRIATTHDVAICREAAVAALGAIGDPAGLPAILHGMKDKATVRRRAVLALAPFDEPEALLAIEMALEDRDRQVRQAAEDLH